MLEHEADLAAPEDVPLDLVHGGYVRAVDDDRPGRRVVKSPQQIEQRALAGAGWTDDEQAGSALNLERDAAQGFDLLRAASERLSHVGDPDHDGLLST